MENQQAITGIPFEKFKWKIENFSKQDIKKLRSNAFQAGGCKWRILVGKEVDQLYLYLKVSGSIPAYGWTKFAYFNLTLINQLDANESIVKETQQKFNSGYRIWGSLFLSFSDFNNPNQGYLVNNSCIIEAHVSASDVAFTNIQASFTRNISMNNNISSIHDSVSDQSSGQTEMETVQLEDQSIESSFGRLSSTTHESSQTEVELLEHEHQQITPSDETSSPKQTYSLPTAPPLYPSSFDETEEIPLTPLSELIDLNALGPEEAAFVPLLEEVCSWHHSLIDSQRKRSPKFILWAFTALGQVLYFLKTKKLRDMTENSCNQLQLLWEELGSFGFDLAWLEPHVKSALGAKAYFERAEQVNNLKDNVVALKIEMRKLKAKLALAEVDIELARRDLAQVEEGFEEKDIEAELGYGIY